MSFTIYYDSETGGVQPHPEIKRPESLKLSVLCDALGISIDGAHDALSDVRMCAAIARRFAELERQWR